MCFGVCEVELNITMLSALHPLVLMFGGWATILPKLIYVFGAINLGVLLSKKTGTIYAGALLYACAVLLYFPLMVFVYTTLFDVEIIYPF